MRYHGIHTVLSSAVQKREVSLVSSIGQFLVLPSLALQHLRWSALLYELSYRAYSDLYIKRQQLQPFRF